MKRFLPALVLALLAVIPTAAVDEVNHLQAALRQLAEMPGVSGYEERVTEWLAMRLAEFKPAVDNLGNVTVTLGSGAPHRLLITAIDEPGYVVSAITPDGYLRVQRLPQAGVHPWFDLLHSAQPVQILTRRGGLVPGVVAGLSTHLHRDLSVGERTDNPERIFIDVGARSPEEVRQLGVDLLDPLTLEKKVYVLDRNHLAGPTVGERLGVAVLVRLIEGMDTSKLNGMLTVAFVGRRYLGHQGLDRLLRRVEPDDVVFVQRLEGSDAGPGNGVLVATLKGAETELASELVTLVARSGQMVSVPLPEPAPRGRYSGALPFPQRSAAVGVGVRFPHTPVEIVSVDELARLEELLAAYVGVTIGRAPRVFPEERKVTAISTLSPAGLLLLSLVGTYGVSGYEEPVVERIRNALPEWAQEWATVDSAGNLIVALGRATDKPSLVFVAHMDEIGWVVKEIAEDGRLELASRGGFLDEHFLGHIVLVHTAGGAVPAVLELPEDYRSQAYKPARSRVYTAWTGARSGEEVERLGIRKGDSVTVPKKFRQLTGSRINGRSFDDRVGSTALAAALWELDPATVDREVIFVWAVEEEIGLEGAKVFAEHAAAEGGVPDFVFAVDTFVSGDSPLESPRFAQGRLGEGFVVRAVDNSNVAPRQWVDRVVEIARRNNIPAQYGVTSGGNDGAAFVPYGSVDVPIGWPLRYSHSAGEVADLKDVEALARIVAALVREF